MSRIHLRSNTLILWLSLSAVPLASALGVGCSSSSDSGSETTAGKGGSGSAGAAAKAGSSSSDAGDTAAGGEPDEGGGGDTPVGGSGSGGNGASGGPAGGSATGNDAGQPGEGGAAGSAEVEDPGVAAATARALALIDAMPVAGEKCWKCHDTTYQGSGFYPNITPDVENGIGSWTLEEIKTAIRAGKDKDQATLCMTMKRYTEFTDAQLTDIAVFLQHLPPKSKKITNKCPSTP